MKLPIKIIARIANKRIGKKMPNDPKYIRIVRLMHPEDHTKLILAAVHPSTISKMIASRRMSALGEYVGLIHGLGILEIPGSIYQGLNRPRFSDEIDDSVYTYHSKVGNSYTFDGVDKYTQPPRMVAAPVHSVFTTFVSMENNVVKEAAASVNPAGGVIEAALLYWEWTAASPFADDLPVNHDARYRRRKWRRA